MQIQVLLRIEAVIEELQRVADTHHMPCGVVVLPHDAYYGVERVAIPFLFRDFAEDRGVEYDTAHLEILKRLLILRNRKQMKLMLQLRTGNIIRQLLKRLEVSGTLNRGLNLPFYFGPGLMGVNREFEY